MALCVRVGEGVGESRGIEREARTYLEIELEEESLKCVFIGNYI